MRLSTNRGDVIDDDISVPRGFALKIIGVEGERLAGSEGSVTQDFVLVNQPAFTEPNLKVFVRNLSVVDATTDTGLAWKKGLGAVLRPVVAGVKALGGRAWTLTTMGGHPLTHPLGDNYYSQVPFRYGDHVAKFALVPVSPALASLKDRQVGLRGRPNGLREVVIDFFRRHPAEWELRVQLRTNARTMPIEDASIEWPEGESLYQPIARITIPTQEAYSPARQVYVDDILSFNAWHCIAEHQPLGSIQRLRKEVYEASSRYRHKMNQQPKREPRSLEEMPD